MTSAIATLQEDNELTRVTRWHLPPNSETGWHTHGYDYVVVPTISGTLTIVAPDQTKNEYEVVCGVSYFRRAGVNHNVTNVSDSTIEFVEIEFKQTSVS